METPLNKHAGQHDWVQVTIQLEDGEELPFMVDTGAPVTVLDKSLESKLGPRLGTKNCEYGYYGAHKVGVYRAPNFFLDHFPLQTGRRVLTDDLRRMSGNRAMGILGMDCLRHYCVQLDFTDGKFRLLDPDSPPAPNLGQPFPLHIIGGGVFSRSDFFGAGKTFFRLDTGTAAENDAILTPRMFRKLVRSQKPIQQWKTNKTNGWDIASFSKASLGGNTYSNLLFAGWDCGPWWERGTILNLQFLARDLVTFNFPKRKMYLKQRSVGPLASEYFLEQSAGAFLFSLKNQGKLPGCQKEDVGGDSVPAQDLSVDYPISRLFDFQRTNDAPVYHYNIAKAAPEAPWKLQRVWQSDPSGHAVKEIPLP